MKFLRFVLVFASTASLWAGLNSAVIVLPLDASRGAPAVSIVQPADYVCAVVMLRTSTKDADRQSSAMREGVQRLTDAISKAPRFQLHQGALRLAGSSGTSYGSFSSAGAATLQTTLRVLLPLQG